MADSVKLMLMLAVIAAGIALLSVSCGGDDTSSEPGQAPDDTDTPDDDDSDDDEVFVHCGYSLQSDVLLSKDLDCSDTSAPAIIFKASGVNLDCGGHAIYGPIIGENPTVKAEDLSDIGVIDCELIGGQNGIEFRGVSGARVIENTLAGPQMFGVMFDEVDDFVISGNVITPADTGSFNGLEIHNAQNGEINANEIGAFTWSGIAAYGTNNIDISGNTVSDVGDTGIGFFSTGESGGECFDITVTGNDVSGAQNVGAVEIMHGSHHLSFSDNNMHHCRQAFYIYDDSGNDNHDISITGNVFSDNNAGISVANCSGNIDITDNYFLNHDGPLMLREVDGVTVSGNTIENQTIGTEFALRFSDARNLHFNNNVLINYERYVEASSYEQIDLRWNYWSGCPFLIWFHLDDDPLDVINPVNSLACPYVDRPIEIVDEDSDGYDDENCERDLPIECVEP